MSDQVVSAEQIIGIVRDVADRIAEAFLLESSFADTVVEALRPACEDIALAYNSFEVAK